MSIGRVAGSHVGDRVDCVVGSLGQEGICPRLPVVTPGQHGAEQDAAEANHKGNQCGGRIHGGESTVEVGSAGRSRELSGAYFLRRLYGERFGGSSETPCSDACPCMALGVKPILTPMTSVGCCRAQGRLRYGTTPL
jgi:hypothetical protein